MPNSRDSQETITRVQRARRAAARQGLALNRHYSRDPRASNFERFRLVHAVTGLQIYPEPGRRWLELSAVEEILDHPTHSDLMP